MLSAKLHLKYMDANEQSAFRLQFHLVQLTVKKVPREKMYVYGKLLESSIKHAFLNMLLLSENGEVIAIIENYEVKNMAPGMSFSPLSYAT
jgi:hypothetical protein